MDRAELTELHFITHRDNLLSIAKNGILCNEAVTRIRHTSVAMDEIQERRDKVRVPMGLRLHEYANLYFHARNPMMYKRKAMHADLTVLRIDTAVLNLPNVVITDKNASSEYCGWWPSPAGLAKIDRDLTFSEDWRDPDRIAYYRKRSAKCAEVLVPKQIEPRFITDVYASCDGSARAIEALRVPWRVTVDAHLFFQD